MIATCKSTSKGVLKLVASFLMQWCMCFSMRLKTAGACFKSARKVVIASFFYSLKDPWPSWSGWWCWGCGEDAGCSAGPGIRCVFFVCKSK